MTAPGFIELFGRPPEAVARAPGRVNLIGEHTDYNGGYVLPMTIPLYTRAELSLRGDTEVRAHSANMTSGIHVVVTYRLGEEQRRGTWLDYVQGATAMLARSGVTLPGFDLRITSDVPVGSGLSSSAALSVALLRALTALLDLRLDGLRLAQVALRVETDFVGVPVGIMDPMAVSLGHEGTALFIDTRALEHEVVPFPAAAALAVIDSGIAHSHAEGQYRVRREECERAAELCGVVQLRDLGPQDLGRVARLPPPLDRRARHVITENTRVLAAVAALRAEDLGFLGKLLGESHASLRDDYQVSTPELDLLVDLALGGPRVHGARLTGGGFGGCVIALAERGAAGPAAERAASVYRQRTGRLARVLLPAGAAGP